MFAELVKLIEFAELDRGTYGNMTLVWSTCFISLETNNSEFVHMYASTILSSRDRALNGFDKFPPPKS